MPRIRQIRPAFFTDPAACALGRDARLLLIGCWTLADDEGTLLWHPGTVRDELFSADADLTCAHISDWMREIEAAHLVQTYTVSGTTYARITDFSTQQAINRPKPSRLPAPPMRTTAAPDDIATLAEGEDEMGLYDVAADPFAAPRSGRRPNRPAPATGTQPVEDATGQQMLLAPEIKPTPAQPPTVTTVAAVTPKAAVKAKSRKKARPADDLVDEGDQQPTAGEQTVLYDPAVDRVCDHLAGAAAAALASLGLDGHAKRVKVTAEWRAQANLLLGKDGFTEAEVLAIIDWALADEFWRTNIRSMTKLRLKIITLSTHRNFLLWARKNGRPTKAARAGAVLPGADKMRGVDTVITDAMYDQARL